jgi:enoyl-CoA hydratase/carnithine racemase
VIELTRHDAVYVLQMRAEENRFRPESLAAINGHAFAGGGMLALARGIVDHAVAETDVVPLAIAIAQQLSGKHPPTLAALETGLYAEALRTLRGDAT